MQKNSAGVNGINIWKGVLELQITERDWKIFRKKIPDWQEAYMEQLVKEYIMLLQSEKTASSKFGELEKRIK